jgi:outer membrane murein-binding lipoprotein Lpp
MEVYMKDKNKLITFSGLTILAVSLMFLSACSLFSSGDSGRIDTLETKVQANNTQIAALQQQVQDLQSKVSALQPATTTPKTTTTTPATTRSTTTGPAGLATSDVAFSNLVVTPNPVLTGQTASISVDVTNNSNKTGSYKIIMTETMVYPNTSSTNLEYSSSANFTPGQKQTVTFTVSKDNPSGYTVKVGTLTGQYTVISPAPTTTTTTDQAQ